MTRVDFHTNIADPLGYACRLARKAYQAGQPLVVLGDPPTLREFDERLWTFSALDFIPHCMADSTLADQTPVVLAADLERAPHYAILLNLAAEVPSQFARFERLLEVVGNDADTLAAGRTRYRFYRDRGYTLNMYKQDA
jgi:DNA polymerase III subunit chi